MNNINNLENTLVIASVNDHFYGSHVFCMFHVKEQQGNTLKVVNVWDMKFPDDAFRGEMLSFKKGVIEEIKLEKVWVFVNSLTEAQKTFFDEIQLEYRFHKDDKALERLASKINMDLNYIGFDGESEKGTWFTCCRVGDEIRDILPEGLYVYSLRASDIDDSQPCMIDEKVWVNHYGDILVDKPLPVSIKLEVEHIEYDEEGNIIG